MFSEAQFVEDGSAASLPPTHARETRKGGHLLSGATSTTCRQNPRSESHGSGRPCQSRLQLLFLSGSSVLRWWLGVLLYVSAVAFARAADVFG